MKNYNAVVEFQKEKYDEIENRLYTTLLFMEKNNTPISAVTLADQAGVSRSTVYNHKNIFLLLQKTRTPNSYDLI